MSLESHGLIHQMKKKQRYSQDIDENGDYNPISDAVQLEFDFMHNEILNQQAEGLPLKEDWKAKDYEKEFN